MSNSELGIFESFSMGTIEKQTIISNDELLIPNWSEAT